MNIDILTHNSFWYALIMGFSIGSITAYIGSIMITKRMTLTAGALGHLTLPGMALALTYNFDISIGALIFLIIGISVIWFLETKTHLPFEALTAIVFTTSVATAFLFLPKEESYDALLGNISEVTLQTCIITLTISGIIFALTYYIFNRMILITISEDIAKASNIPVGRYNFIYLCCIALMIALAVRIVGGLMTSALVAIPASTSKNMSSNLISYSFISLFSGGFSCILGILVSQVFTIPVGSAIILSSAGLFTVSLFYKKI